MKEFKFRIDSNSNVLKFQQLVDAIINAISSNVLNEGDILPSVNQLIKQTKVSRDTVFKAYAELKDRGIIKSVPNKGYFIAGSSSKVFLFLDTFKAYKEVVFDSFRKHLPDTINVDLHFHHYNIDLFETIIKESIGKYSKYIVMNFDHPRVKKIIQQIPSNNLLIIDWKIFASKGHSYVAQDFGEPVYHCLKTNVHQINKYREFIFYYPSFTYHPKEAINYFEKFCKEENIKYKVIHTNEEFKLKKGDLYFLVSDRTLSRFLDQCEENNFQLGNDVGVISYNETPMKKYVKEGISVISTDFKEMGIMAAKFVTENTKMTKIIPTKLTQRSSL